MLKRLGYFREMIAGEITDPSVFDYIYKGTYENKEKLCNYLRKGEVFAAYGGIPCDVVDNSNENVELPDVLTDSVWYWPGDLAYYIEKYDVKIDEKFVQYVKEKMNG